jgi:hypothetical protein
MSVLGGPFSARLFCGELRRAKTVLSVLEGVHAVLLSIVVIDVFARHWC